MLEARKENKVYHIDERMKKAYLNDGFDIYDDGQLVEYTPLKKIKYSDHLKIVEALKAKIKVPDNVTELLTDYAQKKGIDLGNATSPTGALSKIMEAEKE